MRVTLAALALVLVISAVTTVSALPSSLAPDNAKPSPQGTVLLSDPPETRWRTVVKAVIERHGFEHSFAPLMNVINAALGGVPEDFVAFLQATLAERFPIYYAELLGIQTVLKELGYGPEHGVTTEVLTVWQWLSELDHVNLTAVAPAAAAQLPFAGRACSSLITRTSSGTILHARNDDASAHHYTTNLTVDVDWVTVDPTVSISLVARSTQFLGWIGVYTSLSPGVATLTEDQRTAGGKLSIDEYMALVKATPGAGPTHFMMRQAMIDNGGGISSVPPPSAGTRSFAAIKSYLQRAPFVSPAYLILAGVGLEQGGDNHQGAVIVRNFTDTPAHVIADRTLVLGNTTAWVPFDWALVQTNWDFWRPLPYPKVDPRRTVIVDTWQAWGRTRAATVDGMLQTLSIESNHTEANPVNGVLNQGTIFTVMLVPWNSTLRSYLRDSHSCC